MRKSPMNTKTKYQDLLKEDRALAALEGRLIKEAGNDITPISTLCQLVQAVIAMREDARLGIDAQEGSR